MVADGILRPTRPAIHSSLARRRFRRLTKNRQLLQLTACRSLSYRCRTDPTTSKRDQRARAFEAAQFAPELSPDQLLRTSDGVDTVREAAWRFSLGVNDCPRLT